MGCPFNNYSNYENIDQVTVLEQLEERMHPYVVVVVSLVVY